MWIRKHRYEQEAAAAETGAGGAAPAPALAPAAADPAPTAAPVEPAAPAAADTGESALPQGGIEAPTGALPSGTTWQEGLPSDLKGNTSLSKFSSPEEVAAAYVALESKEGNSIRIPGEDAGEAARQEFIAKLTKNAPELMLRPSEDNMDEFYSTLGRPSKPDEYHVPSIEGAPEDFNLSEDPEANALRVIAHEAGLTDKQYQHVVRSMAEGRMIAQAASYQDFSEDVGTLRKEWGLAYDDRYRAAARIAVQLNAPESLVEGFQTGYVDPDTIRFFHELTQKIGKEGTELSDQGDAGSGLLPPSEAKEQIDQIMNNKTHPYWDSHHPEHGAALKKMLELRKLHNPSAAQDLDAHRA